MAYLLTDQAAQAPIPPVTAPATAPTIAAPAGLPLKAIDVAVEANAPPKAPKEPTCAWKSNEYMYFAGDI